MEQNQDKDLFPGQKKGLIRIYIKQTEREESAQLRFYLFDDEPDDEY